LFFFHTTIYITSIYILQSIHYLAVGHRPLALADEQHIARRVEVDAIPVFANLERLGAKRHKHPRDHLLSLLGVEADLNEPVGGNLGHRLKARILVADRLLLRLLHRFLNLHRVAFGLANRHFGLVSGASKLARFHLLLLDDASDLLHGLEVDLHPHHVLVLLTQLAAGNQRRLLEAFSELDLALSNLRDLLVASREHVLHGVGAGGNHDG